MLVNLTKSQDLSTSGTIIPWGFYTLLWFAKQSGTNGIDEPISELCEQEKSEELSHTFTLKHVNSLEERLCQIFPGAR